MCYTDKNSTFPYVTVWAKPNMFAHKQKFILLPQLIATLSNYACSMPPVAKVDWSAFPECILPTMQIHDWWNGAKRGLQFGCGDMIWLLLSVHVCLGLVVEYWSFVGASTCHSYSELYYLFLNSSLFKLLLPQPHPTPLPPTPNTNCPNINEFHEKTCKKLAKTSHCLLVRLVVQKLIDN